MSVRDIATVAELRELLASHPDDAAVVVQVVGGDGTAWSMFLKGAHGRDHGFKWVTDPVLLTLWHPKLETLGTFSGSTTRSGQPHRAEGAQ